jgi:hypothetical protein
MNIIIGDDITEDEVRERAATEEEMRQDGVLMDILVARIMEHVPPPLGDDDAVERWFATFVSDDLERLLAQQPRAVRLRHARCVVMAGVRQAVHDELEQVVRQGLLERSPYGDGRYGVRGTVWTKPGPA